MNIKECIEKRFLVKIKSDKKLMDKELNEADYDFSKAEKAFEEEDYKWSIVKSYYAIFHSARAVLFNLGFKEKRHFAIGVILEDLNKKGKLESRFVNDFNAAMQSREDADYHYIYSKDSAKDILIIADEFVHRMKKFLNVEEYKSGLFIERFQPFLFKRNEQRKGGISLRSIPRIGLFIGRFQPFHKGHLQDVKDALKEIDKLIIAIGSSQYSETKENPFSVEERIEMIENSLVEAGISNYTIFPVPDIKDDKKWVGHVKTLVPKFDVVFTGNKLTEELFKKAGCKVKKVKIIEGINGTTIRDKIIKDEDWKDLVPKGTLKVIKKVNGVKRIKKLR